MIKHLLLSALAVSAYMPFMAQKDNTNGDWKQRYVFKQNTSEADYMIRIGDIDNLGFGWEEGFNPFSGKSSAPHQFPMERKDSSEALGFDMVMIGSSFNDPDNKGRDGYCTAREYLLSNFQKTTFELKVPMKGVDTSKIKNVSLQIFVDDFQPREFGSKFEFYLNSKSYVPAERILNALHQTGPIGKLITVKITPDRIKDFKKDTVRILIDDRSTGLGDGYAIDFVKVLVNPKTIGTGTLTGFVYDVNGKPMMNATVTCGSLAPQKTGKDGKFTLTGVPAGLALLSVIKPDKTEKDFTADVEANTINTTELRFE